MIRITNESKAAYKSDASHKVLTISIPEAEIELTNDDILAETLQLQEAINSDENLTFTGCIASSLSFECLTLVDETLVGKWIEADITTLDDEGEEMEIVPLFRGYIDEVTNVTHEEDTTKIRAYDALYTICQMDVTAWRNALTLPISIYNLRNSFFNYVGVTQVSDYLPNDNINITSRQIEDAVVTGGKIIKAICSINGRFGRISRNGLFEYVHLVEGTEAIYPADTLYPADDLYPHAENAVDNVAKGTYSSLSFENYKTEPISKVQLINKNGQISASYGEAGNVFTLKDNPLVWGLNQEALNQVVINLYNTVRGIWYQPASVECMGLPYVECGDFVVMIAQRSIVRAYVLQRTLKGIQALTDSYTASGDKLQPNYIPSIQSQINANSTAIANETSRAQSSESSLNSGLSSANSRINSLQADTANIRNLVAGKANISDLNATNANINSLSAQVANLGSVVANKADISQLNAVNATINNLRASMITAGTLSTGVNGVRISNNYVYCTALALGSYTVSQGWAQTRARSGSYNVYRNGALVGTVTIGT